MKIYGLILLLITNITTYAQEPLPIGSKAPDFKALDQFQKPISLEELSEKGPVVVVFYRGQWCPHCNRHMTHLQDSLSYLTNLGASVITITPEGQESIEKTVEKTGASFSIIYDENHRIMDKWKVTFQLNGFKRFVYRLIGIKINKASGNKDRALPVPATYIIDTKRRIHTSFFNEDYTLRMPIRDMIEAVEELVK